METLLYILRDKKLATKGLTHAVVERNRNLEHRLKKVVVINADITKVDLFQIPALTRTTHLFTHNTVFATNAVLALEELFWLPQLRVIALTLVPCPRHRARCLKPFCRLWVLETTIKIPVSYTSTSSDLYVFTKRDSIVEL